MQNKRNIDLKRLQETIAKEKVRTRSAGKLKLDGQKCKHCGSKFNLTRHHINYKPAVMVVLCRTCHILLHRHIGIDEREIDLEKKSGDG